MIVNIQNEIDFDVLSFFCRDRKQAGRTIGLTNGCFDMTHYYHLTTLQRCKRLCDILIVAVDSDRLVKETKGSTRPVFVEDHRVALIDGYKPVDFALVMDSLGDFKKVASWIKPDFMFKNDEFVGREEEIVGLKESGAKLIIIPDADVVSSTSAFVEKIKKEGL